MAEQDDLDVGRSLLESGRITKDELVEALFDLAIERRSTRGGTRPLGVLLVARGRITREELNRMLVARAAPDPRLAQATAPALGKLLIASGAATVDQVSECLLLQEGGGARRLGELLVERGYSTAAQIERALAYHDKRIYKCDGCAMQFNIVGAVPGHEYCCEKCGGPLDASEGGPVGADDTSSRVPTGKSGPPTPRPAPPASKNVPSLAPAAQAEIDRAVYVYIKQKLAIRREALKEAERFQLEIGRYGLWLPFLDIMVKFDGLTWLQAEQIRKTDFAKIVGGASWAKQAVPGFKIVSRIASGGFATIFAADPVFGGKRVALKVLHADRARDAESVARFRSEAALMMRLQHPGIVHAHDISEQGGMCYLSMELVEGDSLDRVVCEGKGMNPLRALDVVTQIAEALRYLLAEGYIHRDVKPENILVTKEGKAKLCDLGLAARVREGAKGQTATTVGTAAYMSPEQARGESDLKGGTDIYALGLTLYFMLTAHARFAGRSSGEVLAERFDEGSGGPDTSIIHAPAPVVALVQTMLQTDRTKRPGTYPDLLGAIEACRSALK